MHCEYVVHEPQYLYGNLLRNYPDALKKLFHIYHPTAMQLSAGKSYLCVSAFVLASICRLIYTSSTRPTLCGKLLMEHDVGPDRVATKPACFLVNEGAEDEYGYSKHRANDDARYGDCAQAV